MSTIVSLKDVNKVYPSGVHAVYDFNIDIEEGEFIVLAGPSGCGKSTTLRMIAGLEEISSGDLIINGKRCNDLSPRDRDIAMVFQNYALYAHMTVYHNLAFSLMIRKINSDEIHKRVMEAAEMLGLVPYLNRKPKQLSGGQRQRVAVGRAIVRNPVVYLLDEPLSNLDAKLRASMRKELSALHHTLNKTFIYVTHDQIEALTLADRIVVMKDGYVQQIASPKVMFDDPANLFVAGFIGTPPMNFYHGVYTSDGYFHQVDTKINVKLTDEDFETVKNSNSVYKEVSGIVDEAGVFTCNEFTLHLTESIYNATADHKVTGLVTKNGYFVSFADEKIKLCAKQIEQMNAHDYDKQEVVMASRPDYVYMDEASIIEFADSVFTLNYEYMEHLGAYNLVYGDINGERCIAKVNGRDEATSSKITMAFDMKRVHFFDIQTENRITE